MQAPTPTADLEAGYLKTDTGATVLVLEAAPRCAATGTGVVLVPPFGWEEVASYRARREWAGRLAAQGHHVLRLDLPGTGDSSHDADDPGLVAQWIDAIGAASRAVRLAPGISRVVVVGLGLGGLVAVAAAGAGAVEHLALWGVPAGGRDAVRQQRAFSRLQAGRDDANSPLPEGWLESGGFLLSPETMADLLALDAPGARAGRVGRVLVLGRTGPARNAGAASGLDAADVMLGDGAGYDAMVEHPEHVTVPDAAIARLDAWIADVGGAPAGAPPARAPNRTARLARGGFVEEPFTAAGSQGALTGILTRPTAGTPAAPICAVLLSAGAVRHTGPQRLWVVAARRAAAHGIASLRLDLPGIGDADGDPYRLADTRAFYEPDRTPEVRLAVDRLEELGLGPRFAAVGLCAGGFYAFRVACDDARFNNAVLLNAGALAWDGDVIDRLRAHKLSRVRSAESWRRLLSGDVSREQVLASARALPAALRERRGRGPGATPTARALDRLGERGTWVTLAFSREEALQALLDAEGILGGAGTRWPLLALAELPGRDHTLRPAGAQRAALDIVERVLADAAAR